MKERIPYSGDTLACAGVKAKRLIDGRWHVTAGTRPRLMDQAELDQLLKAKRHAGRRQLSRQ